MNRPSAMSTDLPIRLLPKTPGVTPGDIGQTSAKQPGSPRQTGSTRRRPNQFTPHRHRDRGFVSATPLAMLPPVGPARLAATSKKPLRVIRSHCHPEPLQLRPFPQINGGVDHTPHARAAAPDMSVALGDLCDLGDA